MTFKHVHIDVYAGTKSTYLNPPCSKVYAVLKDIKTTDNC